MGIFNKKPSIDQLYMFFIQFAEFYSASGSLVTGLDFLAGQVEHPQLREAVNKLRKAVDSGKPISEAMLESDVFPSYCAQMIYAGEESGTVPVVLLEIGKDIKQSSDIEKKISSETLRVKIVMTIISLTFLVAFFFVLPRFSALYKELKIELPWITRFVLGLGDFFVGSWYLVLLSGILLYWAVRWFKQTYPAKVDYILFKLPLYGPIYYYQIQYRFAKIFGLLYEAGISPVNCLEISSLSVNNRVVGQTLKVAARDVASGMEISSALTKHNHGQFIDRITVNFIATSEACSGELGKSLLNISGFYESVLTYKILGFSEKIGPFFLTPMMLMILFLLLSIYYPMFMINSGIK